MILDEILDQTRHRVRQQQAVVSFEDIQRSAAQADAPRGFVAALLRASGIGLIGELKPASPSAGVIRQPFAVSDLAQALVQGGADCLSVLTEEAHFRGSLGNLQRAAAAGVPRLQKDFLVSEYQILEGRAAGADAVLLIAEAQAASRNRELCELALSLDMDVLFEAHDLRHLPDVVQVAEAHPDRVLVGINNRDLRTFQVDLDTTVRALQQIPDRVHVVAESGIHTPADVARLRDAGARAMLVGESLMRQEDVAQAARTLLARVRPEPS